MNSEYEETDAFQLEEIADVLIQNFFFEDYNYARNESPAIEVHNDNHSLSEDGLRVSTDIRSGNKVSIKDA